MRRFIAISIFFLLPLAALWAAPTPIQITIEGVEFQIYEVSDATPHGVVLTQNPADHKIELSLRKKDNKTSSANFSAYTATARQSWQLNDGLQDFHYTLNPNGTDSKYELTWRCWFFEANADTETAYQMERLEVLYKPDGTDFKVLNSYSVESANFNTFKAKDKVDLDQPAAKSKVKFLIKCYIRKREAVELSKGELVPYAPYYRYETNEDFQTKRPASAQPPLVTVPPATADEAKAKNYEGTIKSAIGENKVWKNTIFLLFIETNKNFSLSPKDDDDKPYQHTVKENYIQGSNQWQIYKGRTAFGWLITGNIKQWGDTPPLVQIKVSSVNEKDKVKLYSLAENELKPETGGIYKLPKGTEFVIRAKGDKSCEEITAFKLTKQGGGEESIAAQYAKHSAGYDYRVTYRIEENIDDIVRVRRNKEYTINYETQIGDAKLKVVEGTLAGGVFTPEGDVPSGAKRSPAPCGKQLRLQVIKGARQIQSVLCFSENYPAGFGMVETPANSGFYSFPFNADITKFEVKFLPVTRKIRYLPSGCGMLSVQDDSGNNLAPVTTHTLTNLEFILVKVTGIPAGKYFKHFRVIYNGGKTKDVLHDPSYSFDPSAPKYIAKVTPDEDIDDIQVVCGEILSLKFTGTSYKVTLTEGKYMKNGNLVSEVGHQFAANEPPVNIEINAKVRIALPADYPLRPLTKIKVTHADATTQEYTLTLAQRAVEHQMVKSVTEIALDEPTYLSVTYPAVTGKPKLYLKNGAAYDKTTHVAVAVGSALPAASWLTSGAKLDLNVEGVQPSTEEKRITKFVVKMTGGDKEILPAATDKTVIATGDITDIEIVEEDDPAVTGPFTLAWNENPTLYTVVATCDDGATTIVNNSTTIDKGKEITLKITLANPVAGEIDKVVPTLDNGVTEEPLTPTINGAEYIYKYTIKRNTTLQIVAHNNVMWTVNYATPPNRSVFVGTSKTDLISAGSAVRDQTTIYIRIGNTAPDADNYTLTAVKVNGVPITEKDGDFYLYKVTADVTSITAEFTPKPTYTVTYQASQPPASLEVTKRIGGAAVSSGATVVEGTELVLTPSVVAPAPGDPPLVVKKVLVTFEGETPTLITPDASYKYIVKVTKNITAITVETGSATKYKVSFQTEGKIKYLVKKDDVTKTPLENGAEVEDGTKILVEVTFRKVPTAMPQDVVIKRANPNYTEGSSQPKHFLESILTKVINDGGNTYYWYVVHSDVTVQAYFDELDLPLLSFAFASKPGEYTLEAHVGSPKGKELTEGQIYNYPSGTLFYVKVTLDPSKDHHSIAHTFINGVETPLEKQGEWYVVPLRGDILNISFELQEISSSMSLLTYSDPVGAELKIYNQGGQLVPSGSQMPQGAELFAAVSDAGAKLFSMLTVNGLVSLPPFLSQQHGRKGMVFKMSNELKTEVVAYVAEPLPEEAQSYFITVEKPLNGTLKLRRRPDLTDIIGAGETKKARIGEEFELNTQYVDENYELVSNSIAQYITIDPVLHTPIFTVPTLPAGVNHIRVVLVYAQKRPTFEIFWTQTSGGTVSAVNTSDNDANVPLNAKVPQGDYIRYRLNANAGYQIKQCIVNGESLVTGTVTSYESVFRMESNLSILASFEPDPTLPNKPDDPTKPTGVEDVPELAGVTVVPNPFTTQLYLRGVSMPDLRYELLDAQGGVVSSGLLATEQMIQTAHLPSGLYLLRVVMPDGRSKTYRVVK